MYRANSAAFKNAYEQIGDFIGGETAQYVSDEYEKLAPKSLERRDFLKTLRAATDVPLMIECLAGAINIEEEEEEEEGDGD